MAQDLPLPEWQSDIAGLSGPGSRSKLTLSGNPKGSFRLAAFRESSAGFKGSIKARSMGRRGDRYISGRVDKGCLEIVPDDEIAPEESATVQIGLVARLIEPYAVLVR